MLPKSRIIFKAWSVFLMEIKLRHRDPVTILSMNGALVLENTASLKKILDDLLIADRVWIVMNFKEVDSIDSAALAILINRKADCQKKNGDILLVGLNETIQRIFLDTALSGFFRIFASVEEACKSFSSLRDGESHLLKK